MSRWTDLAAWVGPTINEGDGDNRPNEAADRLADVRGLVLHIASGFYDGTIAWQRNASADVSSHFIVARDGRVAQMVDTADRSWAQRSGNSTWLSVELEGFAPDDRLHATHPGWERLTDAQIEVCARLLARVHQAHGVPLQLATSPSGRGLGHHSMGAESGVDWGHSQCPGTAIKAQKPAILARAVKLAAGTLEGDDMEQTEPLNPPNAEGNTIGNALNIATQVRTGLWKDDTATGYGAPQPASALGKLYRKVDVLASKIDNINVGQLPQAAVTAAVLAALQDPAVTAVLVAAAKQGADLAEDS
jgi:hypothetical protein